MVCPNCKAEYTWSKPCNCESPTLTPPDADHQRDPGSDQQHTSALEPTGIDNPFWH